MSDVTNFEISPERILVAILKTIGHVDVPILTLVEDFSNYQIAASQSGAETLTFELAKVEQNES